MKVTLRTILLGYAYAFYELHLKMYMHVHSYECVSRLLGKRDSFCFRHLGSFDIIFEELRKILNKNIISKPC